MIDWQIIWNRLISICEEQAQIVIRAAFSAAVRESSDIATGIFDIDGRMLAQGVSGTPGHVNSMANAVAHFFPHFPVDSMKPGDAFVTNDPWQGSGHLHDITVVTPAFHKDRVVGLFAATIHLADVGGRGFGPDGREVFEEGIYIPHMQLVRQGKLNEDLMQIIRANTREPLQVEGDILAVLAAGEDGARRLALTLEEFDQPDLREIADYIIETSHAATVDAIGKVPAGRYDSRVMVDGYDAPVEIVLAVTVGEGQIVVDYEGTSAQSSYGINVVLAYAAAYTCYGIKCVVAPNVPNNHGSLRAFSVKAPEGSILNPLHPAPVSARQIVGLALPDAIIGCLDQALPGVTLADSGMMWMPSLRGAHDHGGKHRLWEQVCFFSGGMGARGEKDGLDATVFPTGLKTIPIEALELIVPVVVWRKELLADSGGLGAFRGGHGQVLEIGELNGRPMIVQAMFDRIENPSRGRRGGTDGAPGRVFLASGVKLRGKGQQEIPAGDRLVLHTPGGGGYGDSSRRSKEAVMRDLEDGLLSDAIARQYYAHAFS
ncbi:hydantoinase B/oxoprolinase family protein [Rhodoligotrophos defluvii]|uniref:hydantoinase B/oxoprolinase family protein n=1 Tax=Rhodoligotrophos defluvii TaxID=2561934 RepID=UPI001EF06E11|nr:hydantoinase B/oxoprolinase family protein [Rhodoligotrophos defluvii]